MSCYYTIENKGCEIKAGKTPTLSSFKFTIYLNSYVYKVMFWTKLYQVSWGPSDWKTKQIILNFRKYCCEFILVICFYLIRI